MWKILIIWLLLGIASFARDADAADVYFAKKDFPSALREYRLLLRNGSTVPLWLYNAGFSANRTGDYKEARDYFLRYRKAMPEDAPVLGELIRAYQGTGDEAAAEVCIKEYRELWKRGQLTFLPEKDTFTRFVTNVGEYTVYAFEFFAPDTARRDHIWDFVVRKPNAEEHYAMFYVMQDGQAWFLDVRSAGGRRTLTTFDYRPGFSESLDLVQLTLKGGRPPMAKLKDGKVVPREQH
ncbi:MAG: tetratricopeptide repeat protein [Candidatus Eremiobacteraeota bacterium]|nr:tetratricopeptide repeat protein [Candidatus Eremiobacteraeota bacterium]